jgi:hypothetical protein
MRSTRILQGFSALAVLAFVCLFPVWSAAAPGGSVSITSPSAGTSITGGYHITGSYSGVYGIQIAFNAGFLQNVHMQPSATDQGTWYYDWTPSTYAGNVEIMVRGFDTSTRYWDWAPYVNVTVNIATQAPPSVTIVSPTDGSTAGPSSQLITVSASAANGLQSVQCRVDWGSWQTMTPSGGNYLYTWNTNGLGNLTHAIEARATDNNGNLTQTLTNYVKTGTGLQQAPVVNQLERATWIWEPAAYQVVASSGPETELNAFFSNLPNTVHEGKTIYLYADRYDGHYALIENPQGYANFITWAHSLGYKVDALVASGFYAAQMYSYDRYQNAAVQLVDNILNYNIAYPNAAFDGVNTDFEPHGLPDWGSTVGGQWLDNHQAMMSRKAASGQNLNIGAAIPRQFTGVTATWGGAKKSVAQHAQDILDYVTEMCYRNLASGTGNIEDQASPVVSYADQIGKPMFIAVETTDINASGDPAKISFYTNGDSYMEGQINSLYSNYAGDAGFHGMAIHYYDAYRTLALNGWTATPTFWNPNLADTTAPTAPPSLAATAFDFQEIDLNWGQSTDNNYVDHYNIYRSTSSSFTPSNSNLVGRTDQLFYQDTGLLANTTYYYYVSAVDQNGNISVASNEANAPTGANTQNLIPVHISNISLALGSNSATCTITVVDNGGHSVSAVEVFGNWDEAAGKKWSGNTGSNGAYSTTSENTLISPYSVQCTPTRITDGTHYWATSQDVLHLAQAHN